VAGAQQRGFETTFWGDAITPAFLATVRDAQTVALAPMERDYAEFLGLEWANPETADVFIILNRRAMLDPMLQGRFEQPASAEVSIQGVPLVKAFRREPRNAP
jgi:hypothetical protein